MAACGLSAMVFFFKIRGETQGAPAIIRFFGAESFFTRYLTEKGKFYRKRYWQMFVLAFFFAFITLVFLFAFVPEARNEFQQIVS